MAVTMQDVARLAGVSAKTVSRVVNNNPEVMEETRSRVLKAIKELNYKLNVAARSLSSGKAHSIGLFIPSVVKSVSTNPFLIEVIEGISSIITGYDLSLQIFISSSKTDDETCDRLFQEKRVDGLILTHPVVGDKRIEKLKSEDLPFVVVGRPPVDSGIAYVANDNVKLAYDAITHLLRLGHKRIGFINGPLGLTVCLDRLEGYRKAVGDHGLEVDESLIREGDLSWTKGLEKARELLSLRPVPTAIFAINDVMAVGAMKAVSQSGMKVPQDVAVIGVNDTHLASCIEPTLTTMSMHVSSLGAKAARMLINLINKEPLKRKRVLLPAELIVRDSCGAGPMVDRIEIRKRTEKSRNNRIWGVG